jgi:putative hydrolase of the HAD superfamily
MPIEAILFDADGVIQRPAADRQSRWLALAGGSTDDVNRFKNAVFALERPCHVGEGDFVSAFQRLLESWKCGGSLDDALRMWTAIEPDGCVIELIAALRASGVACHLATNQEAYRARYMTETLNYGNHFDRLFFSCHLGCSKPDSRYFTAVLAALDLAPESVLFIDDMEANIASARAVGIRAELFEVEPGAVAAKEMQRILARHGVIL